MSKKSAQLKEAEKPKDPHIEINIAHFLPGTDNPVILRYREAFKVLEIIGEAGRNMGLNELERENLNHLVGDLTEEFTRARQKLGGEGIPLKLSRIWPGWTDDGYRKNEPAPDPLPAKMEDRGQTAKAVQSSQGVMPPGGDRPCIS